MKSGALSVLLIALVLSWLPAMAGEGPDDARTHLIRGEAAIEMAKSPSDLALAVDEFKKATELDPHSSPAWFNLGSVQAKLGRFDEAIQSYKQYLALEPKAADAQKIKDEIIKLEFRQEQINKAKKRSGKWVTLDSRIRISFQIAAEGNRMILTPSHQVLYLNDKDVVVLPKEFSLESAGRQLSGSWKARRLVWKWGQNCVVPAEGGDVTGEIDDDEGMMVLHLTLGMFRTTQITPFLGEPTCEMEGGGKQVVDLTLIGHLPPGVLGININNENNTEGKIEKIMVAGISNNPSAKASGLRIGDQIIAVDGVDMAGLTWAQTLRRLRGEVGSEADLTVLHKASQSPVHIRIKRIADSM